MKGYGNITLRTFFGSSNCYWVVNVILMINLLIIYGISLDIGKYNWRYGVSDDLKTSADIYFKWKNFVLSPFLNISRSGYHHHFRRYLQSSRYLELTKWHYFINIVILTSQCLLWEALRYYFSIRQLLNMLEKNYMVLFSSSCENISAFVYCSLGQLK